MAARECAVCILSLSDCEGSEEAQSVVNDAMERAKDNEEIVRFVEGGLAFSCDHVACLDCTRSYFRHAVANGKLPLTW